jgi:hypothetical protein
MQINLTGLSILKQGSLRLSKKLELKMKDPKRIKNTSWARHKRARKELMKQWIWLRDC